MANHDEHSSADAINQKLDAIIAEQRRQRAPAPASPLREPASAHRFWIYALCLLAAVGVHAIGYAIYSASAKPRPDPVASGPAPDVTLWTPPAPAAGAGPKAVADPAPPTTRPAPTPTIIYQGQVVPYQPPPESESLRMSVPTRVAPRQTRAVIVPSAPATPPPDTPPADATEAHARVARDHAYQYFRYKYKVGSANYGVTSLNVVTEETVELPNWNRHRTTGEAGLEYYDNASLKRTTRKFEVLTETKHGRIVPVEITVK